MLGFSEKLVRPGLPGLQVATRLRIEIYGILSFINANICQLTVNFIHLIVVKKIDQLYNFFSLIEKKIFVYFFRCQIYFTNNFPLICKKISRTAKACVISFEYFFKETKRCLWLAN